jgi:hypothetical protein
MRILKQSLALAALGSLLVLAPAAGQQQGGTGAFKWYVGGQGGVISFRTNVEGREVMPAAGAHLLVTAKRTALLLQVEHGFGSDEATSTAFQVTDANGNVVSSGTTAWTFQGIQRYSAALLAYPIRNPNIQPFIGIGVGIMHTTGNSQGPFADGSVEEDLGSSGFGTAIAGLEFRVGPFSAFGQYQITTKQGFKSVSNVIQASPELTRTDFGEWTMGAFHTVSGGLRFSLGGSRESGHAGGY